MTGQPVLLDLCCRKGGATKGYQRAGFYVVGVDIEDHADGYVGDEFIQADVRDVLRDIINEDWWWDRRIKAVHASVPCQGYSTQARAAQPHRVDQVLPCALDVLDDVRQTRGDQEVTDRGDEPLVLRLVGGASGLICAGTATSRPTGRFEGKPCDHGWQTPRFRSLDMSMVKAGRLASVVGVHGHINYEGEFPLRCAAMGIDWMTNDDLVEAIPPAYTEFIGEQLLEFVESLVPCPNHDPLTVARTFIEHTVPRRRQLRAVAVRGRRP